VRALHSITKRYGECDETGRDFVAKVDPGKIDAMTAELERLRSTDPDEKAAAEAASIVRQLEEKHATEITEKDTREKHVMGIVRRKFVHAEALAIATKYSDCPAGLVPHIEAAMLLEETDDDFKTRMKGQDGTPLVTRMKDKTGDMGPDEYTDTILRESLAPLFKGSGATGTGATGNDHVATAGGKPKADMTENPHTTLERVYGA